MNRKQFLKYSSFGAISSIFVPSMLYCSSNVKSNAKHGLSDPDFHPDMDLELTSIPDRMNIVQGSTTNIYTYKTRVIHDARNNSIQYPDSYIGPIIRVRKGDKIRIRYKNQLSGESIIHWHGLHIPPEMDGHPMYAIDQGEEFIYEFTVNNQPGTYWFHPHPDKITGPQVYQGLAGIFIVEGEEDGLPQGKYDIPLIIQDRTFDTNGQFVYDLGNRMSQMQGFLGDEILVNGELSKNRKVDRTAHRFRILNGSNARLYKLGWSDNSPVTIVATDGGLLEEPVNKPYLMLAPGERVEVWKDFSGYEVKSKVELKSLPFNDGSSMGRGGMGGMMGNMGMQSNALSNGHAFDLMEFTINDTQAEPKSFPGKLSSKHGKSKHQAVNINSPRKFHFYNNHMQWVINGETFEMHEVADWEKVKSGSTEIWQFINGNDDDGMGMGMMQNMMRMPHPVHIHGFSFEIAGRDISNMDKDVWETVKDGFVDEGLQDTFLLMPGMKVDVIISFKDFKGTFIYHCHNLEHEDMGMMRNFEIVN